MRAAFANRLLKANIPGFCCGRHKGCGLWFTTDANETGFLSTEVKGRSFLSLLHGNAVFTLQVTGSCAYYCLGRQSATASDVTLEQSALGQSIFVPAEQSALVHTRYHNCVESLEWQVAILV